MKHGIFNISNPFSAQISKFLGEYAPSPPSPTSSQMFAHSCGNTRFVALVADIIVDVTRELTNDKPGQHPSVRQITGEKFSCSVKRSQQTADKRIYEDQVTRRSRDQLGALLSYPMPVSDEQALLSAYVVESVFGSLGSEATTWVNVKSVASL